VGSDKSSLAAPALRILGNFAAGTIEQTQAVIDAGVVDVAVWNTPVAIDEQAGMTLYAISKWSCPINATSCPWKPKQTGVNELGLLETATITRSAHERLHPDAPLTTHAIQQAVHSLTEFGYCIVRHVLDETKCRVWGQAVLQDFKEASRILLERNAIDLLHPYDSKNNPQSYRELSMREDLRLDLRDGPQIRQLRDEERRTAGIQLEEQESHGPTLFNHYSGGSTESCLRFHPTVLQIVQQTLNPKDDALYAGNFGRYNFSGSGPDGSPLPLRIGPMGGIISLPHSADQAIHADTPHLFETHDCLPAHYVNAFCLGADMPFAVDPDGDSTGATPVGGTAFVHASHKLSFTANLSQDWSATTEPHVLQHLVRPSIEVGDLILFDCRVLHFGLANTSDTVERPMLYTNMTQAWFNDPKNWNDRETIFALEK